MLLKIKYPLLIKYWSKYFLNTIGLISVYSFIQVFINKISLYIATYRIKNFLSKVRKSYVSLSFVALKVLSLKLKHTLQVLFQIKFIVYIFDIFNLLSSSQQLRSYFLAEKVFKFKLEALSLNKGIIDTFILSLQFKIPFLLINYLAKLFSITKNQRNLVELLKQLFQEFYTSTLGLKGFKLHISGKINGSSRTNLTTFFAGKVGLLEKGSGTCYAYIPSNTYTGVFGFKLWLNYKQ